MMIDHTQLSHTDYQQGWTRTTPATVITEQCANEDVGSVKLGIPQQYVLLVDPTKVAMVCYYTPIPLKYYNYYPTWQITTPSRDLIAEDMLQEIPFEEKPRDTWEWLGLISKKCLARSELLTDSTLGMRTETYLVEGSQEGLFDEELPAKLPPPRKSYIIKGRIVSVEKANPTALPLEEVSLLSDKLLEDDLPVHPPPAKSYTVKAKIK